MSKSAVSYKSKLPKVKNIFSYTYYCVSKLVAMLSFGIGAIILAILVFPFIRLFTLHKSDFGIIARAYVSHTFRVFLKNLEICKTSILKVEDRQAFRDIHSKVIIANHPSLLDFVYIMSLVPNSTCIVRGSLTRTPLRGVIKQAYITNNAARIALYCGCDVQPLFIGGSDKYGLGKTDPLWSYNHVEKYLYDIKMLPVIKIDQFKELSDTIAAKHLTEEMEKVIRAAGDEYAKSYTGLTMNNY